MQGIGFAINEKSLETARRAVANTIINVMEKFCSEKRRKNILCTPLLIKKRNVALHLIGLAFRFAFNISSFIFFILKS